MKIQSILQLPFEQKCEQLTQYLDNCMLSTLESVFPIIISDIFGTDQPSFNGWNLCILAHDIKSRDFAAAHNFLAPNGTIFKVIYTLLKDFYIKYRFPVEYLPADIQKSIKDGTVSQFYLDKLCIDPKFHKIYLSLNPYEFYMFNFVKYLQDKGKFELENLEHQLVVDTLYQRLLGLYCEKFLPVCHNLPIEPNVFYTHSVIPALNISSIVSSPKKSSLFKPGVLSPPSSPNSSFPSSPPTLPGGAGAGGGVVSPNVGEVWRSELLVRLFVDFWLQVDTSLDSGFPKPFQQPTVSELYRNVPISPSSMWTVHVFPSGYQVRCIRYVIKHFHRFSSARLQDTSSLGELRRAVLPMIQSQIYSFLRLHIAHWPLDSSFKLIQETWFSFIQPWRYTTSSALPFDSDENQCNVVVDTAWAQFIADNLPAYTSLLQLVLDRFLRLDLNNLFNAHFVFRVAKVYSTTNLCELLKEIETDLYNNVLSSRFGARQSEMRLKDNPRMFSLETKEKVSRVLTSMYRSISHCKAELSGPTQPPLTLWKALQANLHELLFNYSCREPRTAERLNTLTNTIRYLNQAAVGFSCLFDIPLPSASTLDTSANSSRPGGQQFSTCGTQSPPEWAGSLNRTVDNTLVTGDPCPGYEPAEEENSLFLPESSLTLKTMQDKVRHLKYEGDPDLLPPGSGEIGLLVTILYHLCTRINIAYYDQIQEIYSHGSGLSRILLEAILEPPRVIHWYQPNSSNSFQRLKVGVQLPARLSLRHFASWRTIIYLFIYTCIVCYYLSCNFTLGLSIVMLLRFLITLLFHVIRRELF
uniref:Sphingomyelin phosphodiesterase 4 n=1 Tax=Cacopsylla melanoneura TaxID=428564 RepID=A0A8D8S008_9HEMI